MATKNLVQFNGPNLIADDAGTAAQANRIAMKDSAGNLNAVQFQGGVNVLTGLQLSVAAKATGNFSVLPAANVIQPVDCTAGVIAGTLALASVSANQVVIFKKLDAAHNFTITNTGGDTIDGTANLVMNTQWGIVRLYSDGVAWFTF
jgi:hypothetical protein